MRVTALFMCYPESTLEARAVFHTSSVLRPSVLILASFTHGLQASVQDLLFRCKESLFLAPSFLKFSSSLVGWRDVLGWGDGAGEAGMSQSSPLGFQFLLTPPQLPGWRCKFRLPTFI